MNKMLKLPHDGLMLVSDGRKALFLKNEGDDLYPNLKVERVLHAPDNPRTNEMGTDKPGRAFTMEGQRSAVEQTDWHKAAERRFADDVAEALNELCAAKPVKAIVVAAPPRTLAELREKFTDKVQRLILAEINKDLTKQPVYEIEQYLTDHA